MTGANKARLIQTVLLLVSVIVTMVLFSLLMTKGFVKIASYCSLIPSTTFGSYVLFGKYVFLKGEIRTISERIRWGLFFLLIGPVIIFIFWIRNT